MFIIVDKNHKRLGEYPSLTMANHCFLLIEKVVDLLWDQIENNYVYMGDNYKVMRVQN